MEFRHINYHALLEALNTEECPVCRILRESVDKAIDTLLYELVSDRYLRANLLKSRAFCPSHSQKLRQKGDPFAHAILYGHQFTYLLQDAGDLPPSPKKLRALLTGKEECPLCQGLSEKENRYLKDLLGFLSQAEMAEKYAQSFGLCRPHLIQTTRLRAKKEVREKLFSRFCQTASELGVELGEIQKKADYRYARDDWGSARDAWVRAVHLWAGSKE